MTCCLVDKTGKLLVQEIDVEERDEKKIFHLKAIYDHRPATFSDRIFRYLGYIELCEKIAEIADEIFHLFGPLFQRYTNVMVYQTISHLHHGAHDIEHVLHSFCFLGDVNRLLSGQFLEYNEEKIDFLRSASRLFHAVAHFLSTIKFLNELQLCSLGRLEKAVKYVSLFSLMGHALWTASILWKRHQRKVNEQFTSDLLIHGGGFLFESFLLARNIQFLSSYASVLSKAASVAGIFHALFFALRLMPKDQETVEAEFFIPEGFFDGVSHESKCRHHHFHKL